jgi:hypothetical protein
LIFYFSVSECKFDVWFKNIDIEGVLGGFLHQSVNFFDLFVMVLESFSIPFNFNFIS